jgi:hypothetical protein
MVKYFHVTKLPKFPNLPSVASRTGRLPRARTNLIPLLPPLAPPLSLAPHHRQRFPRCAPPRRHRLAPPRRRRQLPHASAAAAVFLAHASYPSSIPLPYRHVSLSVEKMSKSRPNFSGHGLRICDQRGWILWRWRRICDLDVSGCNLLIFYWWGPEEEKLARSTGPGGWRRYPWPSPLAPARDGPGRRPRGGWSWAVPRREAPCWARLLLGGDAGRREARSCARLAQPDHHDALLKVLFSLFILWRALA